jgi:hypothetical protein
MAGGPDARARLLAIVEQQMLGGAPPVPDVRQGEVARLGRDVRVRGVPQPQGFVYARRGEPNPMENMFMQALAGQMMQDEGGAPRPAQVVVQFVGQQPRAPVAQAESAEAKARRMAASLNATSAQERARNDECVVCTSTFATAANGHVEDRVLRVSLMSCDHELCAGCAQRIVRGDVNHGRADCPVCTKPIGRYVSSPGECADCLLSDGPKATPTTITMAPCEHQCLCAGCAKKRVASGNYACPVCAFPADSWRAV